MTSDACDYPTFPDPLTIFISFSILSSPPRAIARPLACKLSLRYFPVFVLPSLPLFLSHPRTRAASVFSDLRNRGAPPMQATCLGSLSLDSSRQPFASLRQLWNIDRSNWPSQFSVVSSRADGCKGYRSPSMYRDYLHRQAQKQVEGQSLEREARDSRFEGLIAADHLSIAEQSQKRL
jgi:hypothetical protein